MNASTLASQSGSIRSLISIVDLVRQVADEMPAQTLLLFLHVARKPDISMRELETLSGLASSSVSRNIAALGKVHRKGVPGLDLVVAYEDPNDRRFKRVKLTPKGEQFASRLTAAIGD